MDARFLLQLGVAGLIALWTSSALAAPAVQSAGSDTDGGHRYTGPPPPKTQGQADGSKPAKATEPSSGPGAQPAQDPLVADEFETAAQWRAWAVKERARLRAERKRLKAELKEIRDPSVSRRRTNLSTKRAHQQARVRRAQKQNDADAVRRLQAELDRTEAELEVLNQQLGEVRAKKDELKLNRKALDKTKNFRILPFIGPVYSPEMGFLVAGGLVSSWSSEPHNRFLPRSSLMASGGYSSTGAIVVNGKLTSFFLDDRLRVSADVIYKDMPDNYWGVGFEAARGPSEPDDTTKYRRQWWWVNPRILAQLDVRGLYAGFNIDYNFTAASEMSPEMEDDPGVVEFGPKNRNGGLGVIVMFDNRDVPQNAFGGVFGQVSLTQYSPAFGSQNSYQVLDLDYRQYVTLVREGSTLAWQARSRMGFGNVPWSDMSLLGSPYDLRAYRWGRYRDRSMVFGLLEYRFMFARRTPAPDGRSLSRHGLVAWIGTGSVGSDLTQWKHWLPNGGLGYRVEVQPRMNLRFDFGIGNDSQAFYLNFTEAF